MSPEVRPREEHQGMGNPRRLTTSPRSMNQGAAGRGKSHYCRARRSAAERGRAHHHGQRQPRRLWAHGWAGTETSLPMRLRLPMHSKSPWDQPGPQPPWLQPEPEDFARAAHLPGLLTCFKNRRPWEPQQQRAVLGCRVCTQQPTSWSRGEQNNPQCVFTLSEGP